MFDFLGFTPLLHDDAEGMLGRKPVTKRVNKTLARIDEVLRKHHDIWEVGMWWFYRGWLNYVAVPGSADQSGPPQAATPVDESVAVPESPLRLEATGKHVCNIVATHFNPTPVVGSAICHQPPEVGAERTSVQVRICAGGAQKCAFLPQLRGAPGNQRHYRDSPKRNILVSRKGVLIDYRIVVF